MDLRKRGSQQRRGSGLIRASNSVLVPDRARDTDDEVVFTPDPLDEREIAPPNAAPHRVARLPGAKEVTRNTIETFAFRALSTPLAAGLTILQARALGSGGTGTYALAVLTMALFSRFLSELGNATTKDIAERPDRLGPATAIALRLCLVFSPLAVVGAVALTQTPGLLGQDKSVDIELALLAAVALAPNLVRQTTSGILVGLGQVRRWNYLQIAPSVLAFVGFLVFVTALDLGVNGAILAWTLGHLLTGAAALVMTREIWWPHIRTRVPWKAIRGLLTAALGMGAVNTIVYINYRIEFAFLEYFFGSDEVGVYRTAQTVAEMLWIITTAIATAIWTTVLHERAARAASVVVQSCLKGLLLAGGAALAVALVAPFVVPQVFGDEFDESVAPLRWLLPGIVAYGPVAVLSIYVSVRQRRPQDALVGPLLSIVVTVCCAYPFVKRYGAEGAALASSAGYIACGLTFWVMFVRLAGMTWYGRPRASAGMPAVR
jgi:stage V sporulation protein B